MHIVQGVEVNSILTAICKMFIENVILYYLILYYMSAKLRRLSYIAVSSGYYSVFLFKSIHQVVVLCHN